LILLLLDGSPLSFGISLLLCLGRTLLGFSLALLGFSLGLLPPLLIVGLPVLPLLLTLRLPFLALSLAFLSLLLVLGGTLAAAVVLRLIRTLIVVAVAPLSVRIGTEAKQQSPADERRETKLPDIFRFHFFSPRRTKRERGPTLHYFTAILVPRSKHLHFIEVWMK
jgi:hypothetical protein